jgi:putative ABC transport system permease protein
MSTISLILKEIRFRKFNFLMSVLGVIAAVALFVFTFTAGEASRRETTRHMRDIGLNLRIIPKTTDMTRFWLEGFSDETMPEEYVHKMARKSGLSYAHLLPMLKTQATWREREVLFIGLLPEISPVDRRKPSMSLEVDRGKAHLGSELAATFGIKAGDTIDLMGQSFQVASGLESTGTHRDATIFLHLHDLQPLVGKQGRINEIQAIDCLCFDEGKDKLEALRDQLAPVLPDARVLQMKAIADARKKQRYLVENYLAMILPVTLVLCAVWIGLLAMLNARQRRQEIGVMRALGHWSGSIAALFLGRAAIVGLVGAAVGFVLGTWVSMRYGPDVFKMTSRMIQPIYGLLLRSLLIAPVFAAVSSAIPTMIAVTEDPATTLREE